jgi:hypothetical protein
MQTEDGSHLRNWRRAVLPLQIAMEVYMLRGIDVRSTLLEE